MSDNLNITGYGTTTLPNNPTNDTLINKNFVTNFFTNSSNNIVGEISFFAGTKPPNGWLFCDGSSLLRSSYPDLSNVIGSTYGGTTTNFNLPDFKSKVPICSQQLNPISITYQNNNNTVSSGNKNIIVNQLPSHSHTASHSHPFIYIGSGVYNCGNCVAANGKTTAKINSYNNQGTALVNGIVSGNSALSTTGNAGGTTNGTTKEFLPPFCVVNFIIYTGKTS